MNIRLVKHDDIPIIRDIYAQYIDTSTTFEYVLPSLEDFIARVEGISSVYPYLVCEDNGKIIAYAYATKFRERIAYKWGVESSIYLDKNVTSRGIGSKLYAVLFDILKLQQFITVYGLITRPNNKSEQLHSKLGFTFGGEYLKAGYKNGNWYDVVWYVKNINNHDNPPSEIIPINDMPMSELQKLFDTINL